MPAYRPYKSLFDKSDAGCLAWQIDGCKDADPKHIPQYVENRGRRRRPFAAPRRCRRSVRTGSKILRIIYSATAGHSGMWVGKISASASQSSSCLAPAMPPILLLRDSLPCRTGLMASSGANAIVINPNRASAIFSRTAVKYQPVRLVAPEVLRTQAIHCRGLTGPSGRMDFPCNSLSTWARPVYIAERPQKIPS